MLSMIDSSDMTVSICTLALFFSTGEEGEYEIAPAQQIQEMLSTVVWQHYNHVA